MRIQSRDAVFCLGLLAASACSIDEEGLADANTIDVTPDNNTVDANDASDVVVDAQQNEVETDSPPIPDSGFLPSELSGLALWLRADLGVTLDGSGKVQEWDDQGPFKENATQANSALRPQYGLHPINGNKTVSFVASSSTRIQLAGLPALAAAHAFVVQQRTTSPPPVYSSTGFWTLTGDSPGALVPYIDNTIYDDFASTTLHTAGTLPSTMAMPNLYEVVSTAFDWSVLQNGEVFYSTTTNVVSFAQTPILGAGTGNYYDGDWAELIIFDHALSINDRSAVVSYLNARYALTSN